tara:strand:- start:136 stop:1458 length:1323 start_codon:yes stop_codon:yes gene_type:complete
VIKKFTGYLFYKIGLLVALFFFVLSAVVFYVVEYYYTDLDTVFDAQELYFYGDLLDDWEFPSDSLNIKKDINNLRLNVTFYGQDSSLVWYYPKPVYPDGYLSYADSDDLEKIHFIKNPLFVSHGSTDNDEFLTYVKKDSFHVFISINQSVGSEYTNYLPPLMVSIFFMIIFNLFITKFLRPVKLMKKRISLLAAGDMNSKITIKGNDELADLSMSINKMIADIKTLLNQKQQLLLDVSHELRSPLARIRLLTEMLPEHKNKKKLVDEVVFLEGMISNLLYSDKLSLPYTNVQYENIKTKNLITKILDLINVDLKRFDINNTVPNLELWVDETKLIIALRNLIDNALKYGDPKQKVKIEVLQKQQMVVFKITNYGNKIQPSDLNSIFKPFFRSQNNKNTISGFGLGLTICKKIVDSHLGNLSMTSTDSGTSFLIEIPIKKS